jgi:hypothetical protein
MLGLYCLRDVYKIKDNTKDGAYLGWVWKWGMDLCGSGYALVARPCEQGNETSRLIKAWFLICRATAGFKRNTYVY